MKECHSKRVPVLFVLAGLGGSCRREEAGERQGVNSKGILNSLQ